MSVWGTVAPLVRPSSQLVVHRRGFLKAYEEPPDPSAAKQTGPAATTLAKRPLGPTLRANPFSKGTDLFCRLPLTTFFYRLEAANLGDLRR